MSAPRIHADGHPVTLRGMTWSDPRGYDPVVAAADAFAQANPGVTIQWDKRSLQGFESTPVGELAAAYDLMVIDHPHIGICVAQHCLLPLDEWLPAESLQALANETVGKSYTSYTMDGHQWALPIDAATQVQAHRPDRGARETTWHGVIKAAQAGEVILPLRPPHGLMCLFTLAANAGTPCASWRDHLLPRPAGLRVLAALQAVTEAVDAACFGMDPIAALDALCADTGKLRLAPLTYFYKGYANKGYRDEPVAFTDIPSLGGSGPIGSAIGGTGIAVSARTGHPALAAGFAAWMASAACQRGLYALSNGQPANALAWADSTVNAAVGNAYFNTRMSHEAAWLRPRHAGYMGFQEDGGEIVTDALQGKLTPDAALDALDARFAASFENAH